MKWLVGIDEAGRGPLAGPVAVGMVKVPKDFDWKLIEGVGDSKKISAKKRAAIFAQAKDLQKAGIINFTVCLMSAKKIDEKGISHVIVSAILKGLKKLELQPTECFVKLDGSLKAPKEFSQETIIKGDSKEKVIGLASILAKETRDAYMVRKSTSSIFAPYTFEAHKGYGTKTHRQAIKKYGLSTEHRKTYCQNRDLW